MAVIESWFTQERTQPVKVNYLDGNVFSMDNNGNLIGIEVLENGEPASISGSVSASVIRADGGTVAVQGQKEGNKCSVILPQACYAVPGGISIVIKLTSGSDISTIGAIVGNVYQSSTDTTIDPGNIIPDIASLVSAIETAVDSIPLDYSNLSGAVKARNVIFPQGVTGADNDFYLYDDVTWEQGTWSSTGTQDSNAWIRTGLINGGFIIHNRNPEYGYIVGKFTSAGAFVSYPWMSALTNDEYYFIPDVSEGYKVKMRQRHMTNASQPLAPAGATVEIFRVSGILFNSLRYIDNTTVESYGTALADVAGHGNIIFMMRASYWTDEPFNGLCINMQCAADYDVQIAFPLDSNNMAFRIVNRTTKAVYMNWQTLNGKIEAVETAMNMQKHSIMFGDGMYVLNTSATFEQGNFTSTGDSESTTWIRTPKANKIQNDFVIYNPYKLQFAVASFYGNKFVGYLAVGTDVVEGTIYRDQFCKVYRETGYEYRIRVSNYMASSDLTPEMSTLRVFERYRPEHDGVVRTVSPAVGNGAILSTGTISAGTNYRYTDVIKLNAGETIHFEFAGPSNLLGLSKWTPSADGSSPVFSFDSALITGDGFYHVAEYTAETDMYVRISTMVAPVSNKPYTNADELLSSMFIFRAETYYDKASQLYGKTITLMGDSLSYGSLCGNGAVWLQRLALKHNMTAYNMGINGNAVTKGYGTGTAMCERYTSIEESDYIIVEGGANDKGGGAPIGTFWSDPTNFVMNTDKTTFMGALNTIISGLRDLYPKAKLLFLTDYNRYPSKLHAYPDAMKEVCMMRSVPCFDNFASSGIAVCEDGLKEWQDEGLWLGGSANYHFTPEAYRDVLLPKYEDMLKNI